MKRNYEDLQREIDNLNNKLAKVKDASADLKVKLDTEDKEKENDVKLKVDDKIQDCDRDINGDKVDRSGDERDKTKPQSLLARKKEIIAAINKMVNQFNDNNKAIKDNNKVVKSEREMTDLIMRNQEIQDDCQSIDDKVNEGKLFAEQIDERLNLILNPTIPELEAKYEEKNALIDECDEKFDGCEAKIKTVEAGLIEAIAKVADALAKIEDASPLNYPSSKETPNKDFIEGISKLNNKGHDLQNRLEGLQEQTGELKDKLMDVIQPLNELGDREVKTPEIQKILD
jgi:predicted  nucleic acid-binding Zn-ribbon protein